MGAYLARMLFLGVAVGFWFFSAQLRQGVLHLRPLQAGIAFLLVLRPAWSTWPRRRTASQQEVLS